MRIFIEVLAIGLAMAISFCMIAILGALTWKLLLITGLAK